jgi:hypothetical protein
MIRRRMPEHAEGRESPCDNRHDIVIGTESPAGIEMICMAAGRAPDFLDRYDPHPKRLNRFNIAERSMWSEGYAAPARCTAGNRAADELPTRQPNA